MPDTGLNEKPGVDHHPGQTLIMTPPLNDHTAKLLMYHVHKIGLALSAFETDLQGTHAHSEAMKVYLITINQALRLAQQEIIDLRDGKS